MHGSYNVTHLHRNFDYTGVIFSFLFFFLPLFANGCCWCVNTALFLFFFSFLNLYFTSLLFVNIFFLNKKRTELLSQGILLWSFRLCSWNQIFLLPIWHFLKLRSRALFSHLFFSIQVLSYQRKTSWKCDKNIMNIMSLWWFFFVFFTEHNVSILLNLICLWIKKNIANVLLTSCLLLPECL